MKQREFRVTETTGSKVIDDPSLKKAASKAEDALKALDQAQQSDGDQYICHCRVPGCPHGYPWINMRTGELVWHKPKEKK